MKNIEVFKRIEQKYLLSENEYKKLIKKISYHIKKDSYYKSKILNIYFDNNNYDLIVKSLEKDIYKEKIRLRSYNIPSLNDKVFFEIKSKYQGIVYKRRLTLTLKEYYDYINNNKLNSSNPQVMSEIDYIIKRFNLKPKYFIAYDRTSYYDVDDKNFRITFDSNIRSRKDDLKLEYGDAGKLYFDEKKYIMELKSLKGIPLWFTKVLSELKIYPTSFSKYGNIYKNNIKEELLHV